MTDWISGPDPTCPITFYCKLIDGPRTDVDLCTSTAVSNFDSRYGDWYFASTRPYEWPPGIYTLEITGYVGYVFEEYILEFELINPCADAQFTFNSLPFTDTLYLLGRTSQV